ncbi:very short patch repair endonuclease [Methylobacterium mesophilicum]
MAPARLHRGDIMSPETRSAVMSRIRGKGTKPELAVETALAMTGLAFEMHARDLPGRPDFVIRDARVAVFVDGDFWHGRNFGEWRLKLSEKWETKIAANIARDRRNRRALRSDGWKVLRIWEHAVKADADRCVRRIVRACTPLRPGDHRSP